MYTNLWNKCGLVKLIKEKKKINCVVKMEKDVGAKNKKNTFSVKSEVQAKRNKMDKSQKNFP